VHIEFDAIRTDYLEIRKLGNIEGATSVLALDHDRVSHEQHEPLEIWHLVLAGLGSVNLERTCAQFLEREEDVCEEDEEYNAEYNQVWNDQKRKNQKIKQGYWAGI
jgi:hypothetical protein